MRDNNDRNYHNDQDDKEVFDQFKEEIDKIFKENGITKGFILTQYVTIPYEGGFLEVYRYDRPRNPRIFNGYLEFEYSFIGEERTMRLKLG